MAQGQLELNEVLNNPFYSSVMEDFRKVTDNIAARKGYKLGGNNFHLLSVDEKKVSRTFRLITSLVDVLNDVRIVYALINRRPPLTYLTKHEISELEYIRFYYDVFLHKVHTLSELMKFIANEVLDIGLHHKDCNWKNLIRASQFNSSKCKQVIQKFYDNFNELIERRHDSSHRGIFDDEELDDINLSYTVYFYEKKLGLEVDEVYKRAFPYSIVKWRIARYKKQKLAEVKGKEQEIFVLLKEFFGSLEWK